MANLANNKTLWFALLAIVAAIVAWQVLTMPDQRTAGEKIGDAVDALPDGVDKAARQLEDRTPGEKLGDAVEDAGEEIQENTDR
jgi:hypothetical protein